MEGMEGQWEKLIEIMLLRTPTARPFTYLEIGVASCETLRAVRGMLEDRKREALIVGIDPEPRVIESEVIQALSQDVLKDWTTQIDLCLIDGCHCYDCCRKDFELVEPHIQNGGVILFHDAAPDQQGVALPKHGSMEVLRAITELGLADDTRPGWLRLPDWPGDRSRKNVADMASFLRL